ncbi:hypothetical protein OXX69_000435 [Metschnikowia pulcherrima]
MPSQTVVSAAQSALTSAVNTVLPSNLATNGSGHVTNATSNNGTAKPQLGFPDNVFKSLSLFGEALAEQSEHNEHRDAQIVNVDRFGSLAAYAFSVYGISTFLVALILNRTTIIASSASSRARSIQPRGFMAICRRSPISQGVVLAFLRLSAVIILALQAKNVLIALNVIGQNVNPSLTSRLARWIPSQYFKYDPVVFADDRYMKMPRHEVRFGPTTDMLWPVFIAVSYSLFVETFSAAIKNEKPFLEGGLTLFELSLAIQEMSSGFFFLREFRIAKRPSEQVLIVCLFSIADQISNQLGAVFYSNKYRLIPSTILSSMFVWYFCSLVRAGDIFSLPSEIALTYAALVLTLAVTVACAVILVLTVLTKGARVDELNFANIFAEDHPQNELFSQYLGLDLSQDFYTAIINLGMVAVTQAGKSSYFMAYNYVSSPRHTWLEQSLWDQLTKAFDPKQVISNKQQSHKILHFLDENQITGYNNIINKPSQRLINGADHTEPVNRVGSISLRFMYFKETIRRVAQLLRWAILHFLFYLPRDRLLGKRKNVQDGETIDAFETRRARAPAFIRHLLKKDGEDHRVLSNEPEVSYVPQNDAQFSQDLSEDDDSPDFDLIEELDSSDSESDSEVMDIYTSTQSPEYHEEAEFAVSSAISELMTPDNILELFEVKDIFQNHLQYDYSATGMMTRSRYNALNGEGTLKDQTSELLDLILSKRRLQMEKEAKRSPLDDDMDDIDPRIACVICQTEPRTLITWPCKCFAICEGCRVSLVAKGMKGCVCCRQDVEGVSRIYLP